MEKELFKKQLMGNLNKQDSMKSVQQQPDEPYIEDFEDEDVNPEVAQIFQRNQNSNFQRLFGQPDQYQDLKVVTQNSKDTSSQPRIAKNIEGATTLRTFLNNS